MPGGLTSLGRWHAPGSTRGWLLCEAEDPVAVAHHVGQWAGLLAPILRFHPMAKLPQAWQGAPSSCVQC